jgi:hypothetical protein
MGLTAGILLIIMSIAHCIYGEQKQLPALKALTQDSVTIGSLRIMIFQGGLLIMATGGVQILMSTNTIELLGIARYFPAAIVLINFCVALLLSLLFHRTILKLIIPQLIVFAIIITLQLISA